MTNSMDQQPGQGQYVGVQQAVVVDIDRHLELGMPVYDLNGEKVGEVELYSTAAGYLMVGHEPFQSEDLYLPFRLIRSIDPHEIYLTEPKDTLAAKYADPPTIGRVVEQRLVPGPGGAMTTQTREVQVVQSGYDGAPVAMDSVDVRTIADRLAVGMIVYDVAGERVGDLTQYDVPRRLLVVEKGILNPRVLYVPFSAIQDIDLGMFTIYLTLPRDVLIKENAMQATDG